jgi:hypothetical protein
MEAVIPAEGPTEAYFNARCLLNLGPDESGGCVIAAGKFEGGDRRGTGTCDRLTELD